MRVGRGIRHIDHDGRRRSGIEAHEAHEGAVGQVELLGGSPDVELLAVGRDERQRTGDRAARLTQEVEQARKDGAERLVARDDDLGATGAAGDGQPGVRAHDASQGVESNGGADTAVDVLVGDGAVACCPASSCTTNEIPTHVGARDGGEDERGHEPAGVVVDGAALVDPSVEQGRAEAHPLDPRLLDEHGVALVGHHVLPSSGMASLPA